MALTRKELEEITRQAMDSAYAKAQEEMRDAMNTNLFGLGAYSHTAQQQQAINQPQAGISEQARRQMIENLKAQRGGVEPLPPPKVPMLADTDEAYIMMMDAQEEREGWSKALKILYEEEKDE